MSNSYISGSGYSMEEDKLEAVVEKRGVVV